MKRKSYSTLGLLSVGLLVTALIGAAHGSNGRWELLGRQEADFQNDHDRIDVGRKEGSFRQIQIRVDRGPVDIHNMILTFDNGETYKANIRHRFNEGSKSHVIDLPGDRRVIKKIDFNYRSTDRREGKATVAVYGR
jgi:hypothetical protein